MSQIAISVVLALGWFPVLRYAFFSLLALCVPGIEWAGLRMFGVTHSGKEVPT
jgi:hypothetical protein